MIHERNPDYTVLVVDDSPESLRMLTDALDGAGMTVLVATDGEEALARIHDAQPDIVLLDAVMPGLDGFETCGRLKRDPRFRDLPVIFMTALSETEHVVKGLASGGVDYVTKPIVIDELIARILVHGRNAKATHRATIALDTSGRALFATDRQGAVKWTTGQAEALLQTACTVPNAGSVELPAKLRDWIGQIFTASTASQPAQSLEIGDKLTISYVAMVGPNEILLHAGDTRIRDPKLVLRERFSLTPREADVLLWVSKGKSNRDIGEILGLSPRTVNKHLEQIYAKLGVENRTAAASIAMDLLSNR